MESGKISERQLAFLITPIILSTVIFFLPQALAETVRQDAWISSLIATVFGVMAALLAVALGRRFPGLTLIEYLPLILGKPLGRIVGVVYALFSIQLGAYLIREFGMFLSVSVMPETPVAVFMVTVMVVIFYAIRSGIEVIARVNEIILPVMIIILLAVFLLPYNLMDFRRLLPVGEHSPGTLLATSLVEAAISGHVFIAAMLLPALSGTRHIARSLVLSVVIAGILMAVAEITCTAVFGGAEVANMEFPLFSLARMINVAKIITRLEVLLVLTWVFGVFIKITVVTYTAVLASSQALGFKEFQFLLFPVAVLIIELGENSYGNIAQHSDSFTNAWPVTGLLFHFFIPLVLYLIVLIKAKAGRGGL
ncbi:MAG: endospore germination permease [Firmicutes bacterium]|nr:endospore germination permease [Bacillota bacterium]